METLLHTSLSPHYEMITISPILFCFLQYVHTLVSPLSMTGCKCIMIIFPCAQVTDRLHISSLCLHIVHTLVSTLSISGCECIMIYYFLVHIFSLFYLQVTHTASTLLCFELVHTLVSPLSITDGELLLLLIFSLSFAGD